MRLQQLSLQKYYLCLAVLLIGLLPDSLRLVHATTSYNFTQISHSTSGQSSAPVINAAGNRISYISDGQNLFLYDTTTYSTTQITTAGVVNQTTGIDAAGTQIVFVSQADQSGDNADSNLEIFLYSVTAGTFSQLTHSLNGANNTPAISANGKQVAFSSNCDLIGNNPDTSIEIFTYSTFTSTITQITDSPFGGSGSANPTLNADGTRLVFSSDRNLTGNNPDENIELFLYDKNSSTFTQVTNSTGTTNPIASINAAGTLITFASDRDLTGDNADNNAEIFLFDTSTSQLTQLTQTTGIGSGNEHPVISGDGTSIVFQSNRDLTGGNSDHNLELFLYDILNRTITQLTTTSPVTSNGIPTINSNGSYIAYIGGMQLGFPPDDDVYEIFMGRHMMTYHLPRILKNNF